MVKGGRSCMKLKERVSWILYVLSVPSYEERELPRREGWRVVHRPPQAVRSGGEGRNAGKISALHLQF